MKNNSSLRLIPLLGVIVVTAFGCAKRHAHHHHGPIGHTFEDVDKWAGRWNNPARDQWQRPNEVVALMKIKPGMTVADLGAGTGYFEPFLSKAVGQDGKVLALDAEPEMVKYLKSNPRTSALGNVEVKLVPYGDPMLPAGKVDRVLIVNTWHHIRHRVAYGRKLATSLASGGSVVVVDFTLEAKEGPPKNIRLAPAQIISELKAAGFIAKVVDESLPRQYIVVASIAK